MLCLGFLPPIQTKFLRQIRSIYSLTVPKGLESNSFLDFTPRTENAPRSIFDLARDLGAF